MPMRDAETAKPPMETAHKAGIETGPLDEPR
jgi:hypothetical protein